MIRSSVLLCLSIVMVNNSMCSDESAAGCLMKAHHFLNNQYDYHAAIMWFSRANDLYAHEIQSDTIRQQRARALIGLAFSYHNVGQNTLRDRYLDNAQTFLGIPDDPAHFADVAQFSQAASEYFIVKGYQFYIAFEQSQKNNLPIAQQEACLHQAKNAFLKSLEIACTLNDQSIDNSPAMHGLGTMFEFLGKCAQTRADWQQAEQYGQQSIDAFEKALNLRTQVLGANHPHVARSHHKLARNYAVLADLLHRRHADTERQKSLYYLADTHYQAALHIFDKNSIPLEHAKRKELTDEYQIFKTHLSSELV